MLRPKMAATIPLPVRPCAAQRTTTAGFHRCHLSFRFENRAMPQTTLFYSFRERLSTQSCRPSRSFSAKNASLGGVLFGLGFYGEFAVAHSANDIRFLGKGIVVGDDDDATVEFACKLF